MSRPSCRDLMRLQTLLADISRIKIVKTPWPNTFFNVTYFKILFQQTSLPGPWWLVEEWVRRSKSRRSCFYRRSPFPSNLRRPSWPGSSPWTEPDERAWRYRDQIGRCNSRIIQFMDFIKRKESCCQSK